MKNIISRGISKALGRGRPQQPEKPEADPQGINSIQMPREQSKILSRCLSIDLEANPKEAQVFAFAAVPEGDGERLGSELALIDGGASRSNLSFQVLPTQRATKMTDILDTIEAQLPREGVSGAVVYCATRNATERVAEFLKQQGIAAERYHAGLSADDKREIQEDFRVGNLRVIAATNAFGMGVASLAI